MPLDSSAPVYAIAGVTGAVGQEFLRLIEQRELAYSELRVLASARSAGKTVVCDGRELVVEELTEQSFEGVEVALFSAGGSISKRFGPIAAEAGAVVVDNSSAFRMTEGVPLVVPEVNPEAMAGVKLGGGKGSGAIIANPNCSTIIMLMAVTPLHRAVGVERMVVSTYQAASGAGAAAMAELEQQTREALDGVAPADYTQDIFGLPYAFNLFSHNSDLGPEGYNTEEMKMVKETHKIWGDASVRITATCVRVPVMRAHAESINLTFAKPMSEDEARALLSEAPGVKLIDDRVANRFPTPLDASDEDDVFVGRIRRDISQDEGLGLDLFVCGDQVRKGAALNAIQIAELLGGVGEPAV
ncbi:MAG: aspartate-semialdehyde dehydrogenase [Planctomycetota bacterium]